MPSEAAQRPVLRIFRCRPLKLGFDRTLRDVLVPDLLAHEAVADVIVGRRGPDEIGERIVASVWESEQAMVDAMGPEIEASAFHPEYLAETRDRTLEVVPLAVHLRWPDHDRRRRSSGCRTGGWSQAGSNAYVEAAHNGAEGDHERLGSAAFYLGTAGPVDFVTLSVWPSWTEIAAATGADIHRPIATRHGDLIETFRAEHFEAVPLVARRP